VLLRETWFPAARIGARVAALELPARAPGCAAVHAPKSDGRGRARLAGKSTAEGTK